MIDWWGLVRSSLWVVGLAVDLAALSCAEYQADRQKVRLRERLAAPGIQLPLLSGTTLFCLGMLLRGRVWWEQAIWGLLTILFALQTASVWKLGRISEPEPIRTGAIPSASSRVRALGWVLAAAGLLVIGLWVAVVVAPTIIHVRSLQSHIGYLERVVEYNASGLGPADLDIASQHLSGMRRDLEIIKSRVGPMLPAGRLLRWVPRYGGDLASASDLFEVAEAVATSGDTSMRALAPVLKEPLRAQESAQSPSSLGERLLQAAVAAQPELTEAQQQLVTLAQARARIDAGSLSPLVAGLLERLDRSLSWLDTAVEGALLAPELLGDQGPRTYLVLAQNNDELRATGGFISGVGELTVERGQLTFLRFRDSYAVDNLDVPHQTTPPDFRATLWGQLFFFRDTNWDADFRSSAQRAMEVYARDQGVQADGVIALDLAALELLVGAIGPLEVPGIAEAVTQDNALEVIQTQWAEPFAGVEQDQGRDWWLSRKDFMGQIAGAVVDRLVAGRNVPAAPLARALKQALGEKHILIYVTEPRVAGLLRENNWDGALPSLSSTSDLLLVADTNVGFNKVDSNVDRSIRYDVNLAAEGGPRAEVTLTYHNRSDGPLIACVQEARYESSYADMMDGCYWDFVRVYAPAGSGLLQGPELPLPPGSLLARYSEAGPQRPILSARTEGDRQVWAAFFALAPGEERTLAFEYQLPPAVLEPVADGLIHYRLLVTKQPGTVAVPLQVQFILPPGAEALSAKPVDLLWQWGAAPMVSTDLRTDRTLELVFRVPGKP